MTQSHTTFQLQYAEQSHIEAGLDSASIHLVRDTSRAPTFFQGKLADPLLFREAMSALYQIYASDLRYKGRDRTAYLQYLQKQAAKDPSSAKSAAQMRQAEEHLLAQLEADAEEATDILDPLLTVHPDEAFLEVFSKDESSYARLSLHWDLFEDVADLTYGTTCVDFSPQWFEALQKLRSYKNTHVGMGEEGLKVGGEDTTPSPKDLRIPDSWLRGFVQVQAAATLPMTSFSLDPIDLYNVLIYLRSNKSKTGPRGLRYELIPGEAPRMILEPTEQLFFGKGEAYEGLRPKIIRTWGRRRLFLLQRLLPFVKSIQVHTLGSGLPTFYVLDMGGMTLTLGLSGWTNQNWGASAQFDAMLPQSDLKKKTLDQLTKALSASSSMELEHIQEDLNLDRGTALAALQTLCQRGLVTYDLHRGVYRFRSISEAPLDHERLRFRNEREAKANELIELNENEKEPLIQITKLNHVLGSGTEIHGEIEDRAAFRTYQSSFFIDLDGRITRTKCTSPWYQRTQGKEGPSEYVLALLLLYRQQEAEREALRQAGEDRKVIVAETRTLTRRKRTKETVYQVTLDHKQIRVQWGPRDQAPKKQTLLFNDESGAREAYFARLDQLTSQGYIDTNA